MTGEKIRPDADLHKTAVSHDKLVSCVGITVAVQSVQLFIGISGIISQNVRTPTGKSIISV